MPNAFKDKSIASKAGSKSKPGKHVKTKQWEQLGEAIVTTHADRFNEILSETDDKEFAGLFLQVLNYFKPKISYNVNESVNDPLTEIKIFEIKKEK